MLITKHAQEARAEAISALSLLIQRTASLERVVLLDDLFNRMHVIAWPKNSPDEGALQNEIAVSLSSVGAPYWTGDIQIATGQKGHAASLLFESVWSDGVSAPGCTNLRIAERHRSRGGWLAALGEPLWPENEPPPIVAFYSFKGGSGRTTALSAFAVTSARKGERVVVIDFDLDAPGAGALFAEDPAPYDNSSESDTAPGAVPFDRREAPWGVVDYLLERPLGDVILSEYYYACRREAVVGSGEILIFSAGRVDSHYLRKLARVDFEPPPDGAHGLPELLRQVREELAPHWILIDCRAGLGEPAGLALSGLAHLHVLFGTGSEQSWQGLGIVVDRLGKDRVARGVPQAACLLVHTMAPVEQSRRAREEFEARADQEFRLRYYAVAPDPELRKPDDRTLYVEDMSNRDAAHRAVPIGYSPRLAHFRTIDEVADTLASSPDHEMLCERIRERLKAEELNESPHPG